jgi:hypothetical protein
MKIKIPYKVKKERKVYQKILKERNNENEE